MATSFENDYSTGAHPRILERLAETNMEQLPGYGTDCYSDSAKEKIRAACGLPDAEVAFIAGGTQANAVIISTMLADYEGVVAASSAHISTHEAGAIEYAGHEVLELPQREGKIDPETLRAYLARFYADENHEHMTFPGMVYLSYPTEYGTLYTKDELTEIRATCRQYHIPLFVDGARLGYGLASNASDLSLSELAKLCDVFYIGGTKVGALIGEAVVFTRNNMPKHFITSVKRRGALLAKGRLLDIQFDTLFSDDLYFEISRHAIRMAEKMLEIFKRHGCRFYLASPTNQQFLIVEDEALKKIGEQIRYSFWEKYDEAHSVVRFATSWSTTEEDLAALDETLQNIFG